jgi:hypothetical protein
MLDGFYKNVKKYLTRELLTLDAAYLMLKVSRRDERLHFERREF